VVTIWNAAGQGAPYDVVIVDTTSTLDQAATFLRQAEAAVAPDVMSGIVLVEASERSDAEAFKRSGFESYLTRPVRPSSLFARLRQAPEVSDSRAESADSSAPVDSRNRLECGGRRIRVLLAEDNEINAILARTVLERHGCEVEVAKDGRKAVEAIEAAAAGKIQAFDIVFMDIHMPVLDGFQAAKRIRSICHRQSEILQPSPPIIAVTANAFAEDRAECLKAGLDDYLSKPVDMDQLTETLDKWVRSPKGPSRVCQD
jgi:CheY-like chemotaxis protein